MTTIQLSTPLQLSTLLNPEPSRITTTRPRAILEADVLEAVYLQFKSNKETNKSFACQCEWTFNYSIAPYIGAFPLHGTVRFGTVRYGTVRLSSGRLHFHCSLVPL